MTLAEFDMAVGIVGMALAVFLVAMGLWDWWRDRW